MKLLSNDENHCHRRLCIQWRAFGKSVFMIHFYYTSVMSYNVFCSLLPCALSLSLYQLYTHTQSIFTSWNIELNTLTVYYLVFVVVAVICSKYRIICYVGILLPLLRFDWQVKRYRWNKRAIFRLALYLTTQIGANAKSVHLLILFFFLSCFPY